MKRRTDIFPININGYHFTSYADTGRQLGIDGNTIRARIRNGWPLEEAFGFKEHINKNNTHSNIFPIDINGYHFISWADAERQLGISHGTISDRIKKGLPLEEAFGFKEHINKGINTSIFPIDINGYHFTSYADTGRQLGIDGNTIRARIRNGWPLEEAFGFKEHINKGINTSIFPIDINGYHFTSFSDAERQLGISHGTISDRIKKGLPLEEAFGFKEHINKGINTSIFPIDINGYHFTSYADTGRQLGIDGNTISTRIRNGWPLEEAFGFKEHINKNNTHSNIFPIDINGYHFTSWADAGRQLGMNYIVLRSNYIVRGMSLEEVFGFKEHIHKNTNSNIFPLNINGYHFTSYADAERQLGIKFATISKRIEKGWTLEEAFGFKEHITLINRSYQHFKYGLNPKEKLSNDLYLCFNPTTNTKEIYSYDDLIKLKEE